ncbi:hypothetical protein EYF80_047800 [Liparis tanakae]|uniref:Uncharacterized protein n=1 Tax=Liparis tanakae TaxID=230148 RepID=A0A4Z2FL95_9TELE|nr:hypothetical protein EYF80_047800 [Liparis tanakae]
MREKGNCSSWEVVCVGSRRGKDQKKSKGRLLNLVARQLARGQGHPHFQVLILCLCSVALQFFVLSDRVFFAEGCSVAVLLGHLIRLRVDFFGLDNKGLGFGGGDQCRHGGGGHVAKQRQIRGIECWQGIGHAHHKAPNANPEGHSEACY